MAVNPSNAPRPIKHLSDMDIYQIRTHARRMAITALGSDDPRVDSLAAALAFHALSYGRQDTMRISQQLPRYLGDHLKDE